MATKNLEVPIFHYDDPATGAPLVGGLVYTYAAGTSTALTTYTDSTLTTPNANPVVLDAYGNAKIWYNASIKVIVRSADTLTTYFTEDNISPVGGTTVNFGDYNLVLNGSFEADTSGQPDNWTIAPYSGSAIAISTAAAKNGGQCLQFNTAASSAGGGTATTTLFAITASTPVQVRFSYYSTDAATTNVVQIFWYTLTGAASSTPSTTVHSLASGNPTSWTDYTYTTTAPADATQATIVITGVSSGGGSRTFSSFFDGINVQDDATTLGTVMAYRPVVVDANKDATGFGKITGSTSTGHAAEFTYTGTTSDVAAVRAYASGETGASNAVEGVNDSATGRGVLGYATHTTGVNTAGYFQSASSAGYGVYAITTAAGGIPISAHSGDVVDSNPTVRAVKGEYQLHLNPRLSGWNPIVEAGDQGVIALASGAIDTGVLTLAPQATDAVGIRIDSTDDSVDLVGTLIQINGTTVTSTAAELNILDGVTASAAELNYNDITTLGTAQASKVLTLDASSNIDGPFTIDSRASTSRRVLIEALTASSSASLDFDLNIDSTYTSYEFVFEHVECETDSVNLLARIYTGGAWQTGGFYVYGTTGGGTAINLNSTTTIGSDTEQGVCGTVLLTDPANTGNAKILKSLISYHTGGGTGLACDNTGGYYYGAYTAVTGVRFLFSSGNIRSGTIRLYGIT